MSLRAQVDEFVDGKFPVAPEPGVAQTHGLIETSGTKSTRARKTARAKSSQAVDQVMKYIPTEVLAAYVPLVALATPANGPGDVATTRALWVLFAVFLVCTPLAIWLLALAEYRRRIPRADRPTKRFEIPLFDMIAGFVAFATWAAALPNTVFQTVDEFKIWMGTGAVIVVLFLLNIISGVVKADSPKPANAGPTG